MGEERRTVDLDLLMDVRERTARIEARGEARDAWQATTTEEIKKLRTDMAAVGDGLRKLLAEIETAKTVARFGGGLLGYIMKLLPYGAAGGVGWLASLFLPPR